MNSRPQNILVCYPRSGSTWLRYIIEYFTNKATMGGYNVPLAVEQSILKINTPSILTRKHEWDNNWNPHNTRVLLLVRNYKECIIRNMQDIMPVGIEMLNNSIVGNKYFNYILPIISFNDFDGKKQLMYYEDLIQNLESEIKKMLSFFEFEISQTAIEEFIHNVSYHKSKSIEIYNTDYYSETGGATISHHANKLTRDQQILWDNVAHESAPVVYQKYLTRYKTI